MRLKRRPGTGQHFSDQTDNDVLHFFCKAVATESRKVRTFHEPYCPSFSTMTKPYTAMSNPCIPKVGVQRQAPTHTLRLSLPLQRPQERC